MAAPYKQTESLGILIFKNGPDGAALTVADGSPVFWLAGNGEQYTTVNPRFQTTAAIETGCFTAPEKRRTSGSDLTLTACENCDPDFLQCAVEGWVASYDAAGLAAYASIEKPGDECTPCGNKTESASGGLTVIQFACATACDSSDSTIVANVFRNVPQFTGTNKRFGRLDGAGVDYTAQPQVAGDGWGFGPCDWFESYDANGDAETSAVTIGCELSDEQCAALQPFLDSCSCNLPYSGCAITEEAIEAGIVPKIELLTC